MRTETGRASAGHFDGGDDMTQTRNTPPARLVRRTRALAHRLLIQRMQRAGKLRGKLAAVKG